MSGGFFETPFEEQTFRNPLFFKSSGLLTDALEDGIVLSTESGIFLSGEVEETIKVVLQVAHVEQIIYQNLQASNLNRYNDCNPFIEYSTAPDNT